MEKNRYNLALLPVMHSELFVALAGKFSAIAAGYQLGKHSLPHVTLAHFVASPLVLEDIWQAACRQVRPQQTALAFRQLSFTTTDQRTYWISLVPDERLLLQQMHEQVVDVVGRPLNHAGAHYNPHLTLVNTTDPQSKIMLAGMEKSMQPVRDSFVLSLGEADTKWQYQKMIFTCAQDVS